MMFPLDENMRDIQDGDASGGEHPSTQRVPHPSEDNRNVIQPPIDIVILIPVGRGEIMQGRDQKDQSDKGGKAE